MDHYYGETSLNELDMNLDQRQRVLDGRNQIVAISYIPEHIVQHNTNLGLLNQQPLAIKNVFAIVVCGGGCLRDSLVAKLLSDIHGIRSSSPRAR